MQNPINRPTSRLLATSFLTMLPLLGCSIREEPDHENLLGDNLRVLAIRSVPAEIPLGGTGTISALIHEPRAPGSCADSDPQFEWSWCPLRGGAEANYECLMPESELREIWSFLGDGSDLPAYALGSERRIDYLNVLGDLAQFVCSQEIEGADETAQLEFYNCVQSFQVSVRVDVSWCGQKQSAVKTLSLLGENETADDAYVPNTNPDPSGVVTFSPAGDPQTDLTSDDSLEAGVVYNMSIELDEGGACEEDDPPGECIAETFVPDPVPGIDDDEPRRERLVMSWYVSKGNTSPEFLDGEEYQPDTDSEGGKNTYFLETDEQVEAMLGNLLSLEDEDAGDGEIVVVLRDERGGVDWARYSFTVEEAR